MKVKVAEKSGHYAIWRDAGEWVFGIIHQGKYHSIYYGVNPDNGVQVYINEWKEESDSLLREEMA